MISNHGKVYRAYESFVEGQELQKFTRQCVIPFWGGGEYYKGY